VPSPGVGRGRGNIFEPTKAAQHTLELRISRFVGGGMHEDLDLTNFTQQELSVQLVLHVDADFADQETAKSNDQRGSCHRQWQCLDDAWQLVFDYRAEHAYHHGIEQGVACLHRGMTLRIENAASPPSFDDGRITFAVKLRPHGRWHACLNWTAFIDGQWLQPYYGCHSFAGPQL